MVHSLAVRQSCFCRRASCQIRVPGGSTNASHSAGPTPLFLLNRWANQGPVSKEMVSSDRLAQAALAPPRDGPDPGFTSRNPHLLQGQEIKPVVDPLGFLQVEDILVISGFMIFVSSRVRGD